MRAAWWLIAGLSTAAVLVACLLPESTLPSYEVQAYDKLLHAIMFAVVGFSWSQAGLSTRWVLAIGIPLAAGTELAQAYLITGRSGSLLDLLADLIGLAIGLIAFRVWRAGLFRWTRSPQ